MNSTICLLFSVFGLGPETSFNMFLILCVPNIYLLIWFIMVDMEIWYSLVSWSQFPLVNWSSVISNTFLPCLVLSFAFGDVFSTISNIMHMHNNL